jgi:prepilin-type N-terminal cleavage/methylation domain-containing protein
VIGRLAHVIRTGEDGYSLVEMIIVMAILGVVLAGLSTVFVSGSSAEAHLNQRFQAQQRVRAALDRVRNDVHCASKASAVAINTYPALRLDVTSCNTATTYDYWCVVSANVSTLVRYNLYRTYSTAAPTAATCTSTDASRIKIATNLVSSAVFTTNVTPLNGLQVVAVDFKVSGSPRNNITDVYELTDSLVARNSTRCSSTAGGWDSVNSRCTIASVP